MSDPRIRRVQEVFNTFFGDSVGYVDETGKTGWNVVNGLIRALQFKLGIAPQVDSFGNGTYDQYELQIAPLTVSSDPQVILLASDGLVVQRLLGRRSRRNIRPRCTGGHHTVSDRRGPCADLGSHHKDCSSADEHGPVCHCAG